MSTDTRTLRTCPTCHTAQEVDGQGYFITHRRGTTPGEACTERPATVATGTVGVPSSLDQLIDAFVARDEAKADAVMLGVIDRHLARSRSGTAQDFLLDHRNTITRRIAARAALADSREG